MLPAVLIAAIAAALLGSVVGFLTDADTLKAATAAFTFANTVLLVWHAQRTRKIEPKVDQVERIVTQELGQWGGEERREHGE